MKKYLLLMFVNLFLITCNPKAQSGWIQSSGNFTYDLKCAVMPDSQYFICAGEGNKILISSDGGNIWQEVTTDFYNMIDIDFINSSTGYLLNEYFIIKTTNKGINWTYIDAGPYTKTNVDFINELTGFVSGTDVGDQSPVAYVNRTTNGGVNWNHYQMYDIGISRNVKFFNQDTGVAFVCNRIHYSTNGGVNWSQRPYIIECFNSLSSFSFNSHISFGFSGKIYKTNNCGVSWIEQLSGTTKNIYNSFFTDSSTGYAVGDSGLILRTSNGGINWTIQNSNTTKKLFDVYFTDHTTGIIAGEDGTILTTTTGGLTFLNSNSEFIPEGYYLSQNYPNPFNPVTEIEFGIPDLEFVTLKVYDALGKEVRTIVNENLSQGNFKAEFDGSDLPSGIFYYKLEAGDNVLTRKMLLLK